MADGRGQSVAIVAGLREKIGGSHSYYGNQRPPGVEDYCGQTQLAPLRSNNRSRENPRRALASTRKRGYPQGEIRHNSQTRGGVGWRTEEVVGRFPTAAKGQEKEGRQTTYGAEWIHGCLQQVAQRILGCVQQVAQQILRCLQQVAQTDRGPRDPCSQ